VTTREGLRGLERAGDWQGVYVAPDTPAAFAAALVGAVRPDAPELEAGRAVMRGLTWDALAEQVESALMGLTRPARPADAPRVTA
jgi:hypothetical protein